MDTKLACDLFDQYSACARQLLDAGWGDNHAAPVLDAAVDLVIQHPDMRGHVIGRVVELMQDRWGHDSKLIPEELAQLLAHCLRWPEFERLAHERLISFFGGDRAAAASDVALHLEDALRDDWEGREGYRPR